MNVKSAEQKAEKQIQFWAILGPFILLATLVVLYIKVSDESLHIPVAALIGLPICWKWKMKGLTFSLLFLGILTFLTFNSIPAEDRLWQAGLSVAVALSFVVTALSAEEALSVLSGVRNLSGDRNNGKLQSQYDQKVSENDKLKIQVKDHELQFTDLIANNEKLESSLKERENQLAKVLSENERLVSSTNEEQAELNRIRSEILHYESLLEISRNEIQSVAAKHEAMATELIQKQNQVALFEERIEEISFENAQLYEQMSSHGKESLLANQKLMVQERLIEETNLQLSAVQQQADEARSALQEYEAVKNRVHSLEIEVEGFADKLKASEAMLQQVQHEKESLLNELKQFQEPADLAEENDLKKLKGLCKHYREQVKDRSDLLAEARKQLFHTEEKLASIQKDYEEAQKYDVNESEKVIESHIAQLDRESSAYKKVLQDELKELQDLIGDLFTKGGR